MLEAWLYLSGAALKSPISTPISFKDRRKDELASICSGVCDLHNTLPFLNDEDVQFRCCHPNSR